MVEYTEYKPLRTKPVTFGPTKHWDRLVAAYPYRADVPMGAVPPISRVIALCLIINRQRVGEEPSQRWAFKKRSHRDQFVAAWKHKGACNA